MNELTKKYYDALQQVNNLVRDARKVQQTVLIRKATAEWSEDL